MHRMFGQQAMVAASGMMGAPGMAVAPGMAAPGMVPGMAAPGFCPIPPAGLVNLDVDLAPGFATLDVGPACFPPVHHVGMGMGMGMERREEVYERVETPVVHVVRKGDTVWKLSKRYGTTMQAIILANNLRNPDLIYPGQTLFIPGATEQRF